MVNKRQIEIFSAGCPVCQEAVELVNQMASDDDHRFQVATG